MITLRDGDAYACSCEFSTPDVMLFQSHLAKYGLQGHRSVGKINIATRKSANDYYYNGGKGPVKKSVLSGSYMEKKKPKKKKKTLRKPVSTKTQIVDPPPQETEPQEPILDNEEDPLDIIPEDTPEDPQQTEDDTPTPPKSGKKGGKTDKSTSRTAEHVFEAVQIKLVPKVYTITLTPTVMMTFHIVRNIIGCPDDWDESMILDWCLTNWWNSVGINHNTLEFDPQFVVWLKNRDNGSEEEQEVRLNG